MNAVDPVVQHVDLNADGDLVVDNAPVPHEDLADQLAGLLRPPPTTTDIFVFVHGWRTSGSRGSAAARQVFQLISDRYADVASQYPQLRDFQPYFVAVRWPSVSSPLPTGYRRIRARAHAMTTEGHAAYVLAHLLGYLDSQRISPTRGPGRLRTATGQYLHCIGHSFGARFLGEAIMAAALDSGPPLLGWPWRGTHQFGVDTFVGLQMAAPPAVFADRFAPLLNDSPLHGPVVLTFSHADRANRLWHYLAEGALGIGGVGAREPAAAIHTLQLHRLDLPYVVSDVPTKILNIDATWRFQRGAWRPEGAHSDYLYPESAHLILSMIELGR